MGAAPDSYPWIRAAQYANCTPWELIARDDGIWWRNELLATQRNETQAQQTQARRRQQHQARR